MFPINDNIPSGPLPVVKVVLIIANVVVYLLAIRHGGSFFSSPTRRWWSSTARAHSGAHCAEFAQQTLSGPERIGVFCSGQTLPDGTTAHVGAAGTLPTWETVFTSMFMHGSFLHIAGNMLFLWIFGNNVEDSMGPVKFFFFFFFYLLGGIAALALQVAIDQLRVSRRPNLGHRLGAAWL